MCKIILLLSLIGVPQYQMVKVIPDVKPCHRFQIVLDPQRWELTIIPPHANTMHWTLSNDGQVYYFIWREGRLNADLIPYDQFDPERITADEL